MSRWDDASFDSEKYNLAADNEEIRLLKKFEDYKELEKIESEKRNSPQLENIAKTGIFGRYLHGLAVIQGIAIAGFSAVLMFMEFISSDIKYSLMSIAAVALAGEVVMISFFLKKKNNLQENSLTQFESKTEFDRI